MLQGIESHDSHDSLIRLTELADDPSHATRDESRAPTNVAWVLDTIPMFGKQSFLLATSVTFKTNTST